ncbi:hypothetical protein [Sorangium sp. So ce1151]|uniref:hypothetical protein n=1 Tax=Sorangium sp. So ce1151 TaxID=3133332 RepID=UPI003F60F657
MGTIGGEEIEPTATGKCPIGHQPDDSGTNPPNPRAALVAALTDGIKVAAFAGDLEAARVASEALAQLLGGEGSTGSSTVIDLQQRRERREQK